MPESRISRRPIHPGVLLGDVMEERGISYADFARQISIPVNHLVEVVEGERSVDDGIALRLGQRFDMEPDFWIDLQTRFDSFGGIAKTGRDTSGTNPPNGDIS